MHSIEFRATGEIAAADRRRWDRKSMRIGRALGWSAAVVIAAVVISRRPPMVVSTTAGRITNAVTIPIDIAVRDSNVDEITIDVNGQPRQVSRVDGRFHADVPLVRGRNVIQAVFGGVASPPLIVEADLPPADVRLELTWQGPADIDLHLVLPDGRDCFYDQKDVGGAKLDFDNTRRDGPEHITMEKAAPGAYMAFVRYWSPSGRNAATPVSWRVVMRLRDGRIVRSYSGQLTSVGQQSYLADDGKVSEHEVNSFKFP